ncbi:membrane protein, partial [Lacticaseibacillus rhamnosus]
MSWIFALLIQLSFSYLATVAFAIIINVPRKALNLAGWSGMMGWLAYWLLMEAGIGRMMANLTGAFVIGL